MNNCIKDMMKKLLIAVSLLLIINITMTNIILITKTQVAYGATLKLNIKSATLIEGEKISLKVMNLGKSQTVKWSSSDKTVATVNKNGTVVGVSAGKANITATVDKKKLVCEIDVEKEIVNEPDVSIEIYQPDDLKTSIIFMSINNNGDLPFIVNSYGYVYNDGYPRLSDGVFLFDINDENYALLDSITIESGEENSDISFANDEYGEFWVDSETCILFNFTYDDVEFTGIVSASGYFTYSQGHMEEE